MEKGKLVSALIKLGDVMALIQEAEFNCYFPINSGGNRVLDVFVNEETWNELAGPVLVESLSQTTPYISFRLYKMLGKSARAYIHGNAAPEEVAKWREKKPPAVASQEEEKLKEAA